MGFKISQVDHILSTHCEVSRGSCDGWKKDGVKVTDDQINLTYLARSLHISLHTPYRSDLQELLHSDVRHMCEPLSRDGTEGCGEHRALVNSSSQSSCKNTFWVRIRKSNQKKNQSSG